MSGISWRKNALAVAILSIGVGMGSAVAQAGGTGGTAGSTGPSGGTSATPGQGSKSSATTTAQGDRGTQAGGTSAAKSTLDRGDRKFVEEAAAHGMAEVELGNLAKTKATSEDVKKFAEKMVEDHSKANDQLKQLASSKGVQLPSAPERKHQREMERLQKLSGAEFDREYMKHMVSDHKKDVSDFEKVAKNSKDSDLKSFASSTLPTLQEHLKLAQTTHDAVKGDKGRTSASGTSSGSGTTGTSRGSGSYSSGSGQK